MKKSLLIKRIFLLAAFVLGLGYFSFGQALLVEDFDYPNGSLLTDHGWTAHSAAGTNPIDVVVPGLSFTGYPSSGIGGAAQVDNTSEDVHKVFSTQTSGAIYAAALIKVNAVVEGYFLHLGQATIGTTFFGRLYMKPSGSNFVFGLARSTEAATYGASEYTLGTTYLVVLKLNLVEGTNNDEVSLYIFDTTIPSTEPATATIPAFTTGVTDYNPGSIAFRQFSSSQNVVIDGIRIANNWTDAISDLTPPVAEFDPANEETDVPITVVPNITFDEPIFKTDGSEVTNIDLASLITFKETDAAGETVAFTAVIDDSKKVITITPDASLNNSQVYYLAVGAVEDHGGNESTGSSITFTTIAAAVPTVTLTSPAGGETYYAGQETTLTWLSANVTNLLIQVYRPEGDPRVWDWETFIPDAPAGPGSLDIVVPANALYGTEYKIRITSLDHPSAMSTSGDFTVIANATSISDLKDRCIINDIVKLNSEATVTFLRSSANRNQKYIQDDGAGMLIDDASAVLTTALAVGDNITGFEGKLGSFAGMYQLVPTKAEVTVASSGNAPAVQTVTIADYTAAFEMYESRLIKLQNVSFPVADGSATFGSETTYDLTDGTNTLKFFTFEAPESNIVGTVIPQGNYEVTGLALRYNANIEIASRTLSDLTFTTRVENTAQGDPVWLYPVPATSVLNLSNVTGLKSVDIIDMVGKVITTITTSSDEIVRIPVSDLTRGTYLLKIYTVEGILFRRFVKQ